MSEMTLRNNSGIRYALGIDGGGTKTALMLTDADGTVCRTLTVDGCNPMDIGFARTVKLLRNAIDEICEGIPMSEIAMFAGIAGGGSASARKELNDFFSIFEFGAFDNQGDTYNILEAALDGRDGISVIIGTGICVQARSGENLYRVGGWGYFVDRGGSGFNLGRDALDAYYSAYDGSGEETLLSSMIETKTQCTPQELVGKIYAGGKTFVASFAPLVSEAARQGDSIAHSILERNTDCIARVILAAAKHFPAGEEPIPVVLCGGLSHDAEIVAGVKEKLASHPRLSTECLTREPVIGAVMLAKKLGGL